MPVYEYVCPGCRKTFEVVRPITEYGKKAVACPKCRSKKVKRRWSSVSVQTSTKS
jgi:putative FmdB family regulatory protein